MAKKRKIEYRVIWVSPPDPVKIMTEFGKIWSREHGLEFDGVYTKEGGHQTMSWNLFFMILGVTYAATWVFKIVDFIEGGNPHEKA